METTNTKKLRVIYLQAKPGTMPEVREIDIDNDRFYQLIDCRCVDIPTRLIRGKPYCIICDDEGLLKDNPPTTVVTYFGTRDIVGSIILTGPPDKDGELTSLTKEDIKALLKWRFLSCYRNDEKWSLLMVD